MSGALFRNAAEGTRGIPGPIGKVGASSHPVAHAGFPMRQSKQSLFPHPRNDSCQELLADLFILWVTHGT